MKLAWSMAISFLLLLLVAASLGTLFFSSQPLHLRLGTAAPGLLFLATFINMARPAHPAAGKMATLLQVGAAALFFSAVILGLQR